MDNKIDYMEKKIRPIMEALIFQLLCDQPDDPGLFTLDWLQKTGGYTANGLRIEEKKELDKLRNEIGKFRKNDNMNLSSVSDDNDEEFKKFELEVKKKAVKKKGQRRGVSAEAYGKFNRKVSFKYLKIYKTPEQIAKIKSMIMKSFLFNGLDHNSMEIVIDAFVEKNYE